MPFLIVTRAAEFGPDGMPVRGQCEPHFGRWQLVYFNKGEKTFLYEDSYYVCRQLQSECSGLPFDEAKQRVAMLVSKLASSETTETVRLSDGLPVEPPQA